MTPSGKFGMYISLGRPLRWLIVNITAHELEVQKHRGASLLWNVDKRLRPTCAIVNTVTRHCVNSRHKTPGKD